jgi:hypothetical protein
MIPNRLLNGWRPAAALAALAVAACQHEQTALPRIDAPSALVTGVEVSALRATPGTRIAVAVRAEPAGGMIAGLQGDLQFDASRLAYLGQAAEGPFLAVNSSRADQGELRLAAFDVAGMPERAAVLVFEVRGAGYERGLRFDLEVAASLDAEEIPGTRSFGAREASDLALPAAYGRFDMMQVASRLWPDVVAADARRPQPSPGSYLLNLRYGDARLDGNVNIVDAADIANTAVGNNALIVGTDSPNRDRVVAANVRPSNLPGLGEVGDAVPPGLDGAGTRTINILDAVAVANEAVGNPQDIAGELIPGRGPVASDRVIVAGNITADRLFDRDTIYELRGIVQVDNGATLTIEAGTRIEGQTDTSLTGGVASALFVNRNGRIVADGTPLQPIVMTCTGTKVKGCWGGLWVAGNAPINPLSAGVTATSPVIPGRAATGGCNEVAGEGGATVYGGCNPDDSSGVLRYVVEEYSGKVVSGNNELNGISMGGVGRKTVVEFIQVANGLDDGLELFGGTVNVRGLYSIGNSDDSFDYCCGWNASAQFIIIQHDSLDSDKGFEVDNTEQSGNYDSGSPVTNPQVYNVTIVGRQTPTGTSGVAGNNSNDALHLRRGNASTIRNLLAIGVRSGLDIDDAATCNDLAGEGIVSVQNSIFARYGVLGNGDGSDPTCATPGAPGTAANETDFINQSNNQTFALVNDGSGNPADSILIAPFSYALPDFRPFAAGKLRSGLSLVGATPPGNGFFDVTATYIGAVPQANSTGTNIPWYSGWTKGY